MVLKELILTDFIWKGVLVLIVQFVIVNRFLTLIWKGMVVS